LYDLRQTGGPMFEQYMRNAMLLIMEHPESGSTLMEIPKVMADPEFRHFKLKHCTNPVVRDFWIKEAEKAGGEAALSNMTPYITSKLNQFISNDIMRPIIGQQASAFNFRKAMDEGKIVLVTLPKGLVGDLNAYLLGLVIVGKITMAAFSRADTTEENRRDFYLYIDEFQNFITDTIGVILSEARKYKLDLTIAHQYMGQLTKNNDTSIRDAVLGTVGTMIAFNIGIEDAQVLVKQFAPVLNEYDLINVERFNAYVKLLVDKEAVRPFNMLGMPPRKGNEEVAKLVKEMSHLKYGRPKAVVESEILERAKAIELDKKPTTPNYGPASTPTSTL
ncbi:MAG: type IV secretory system conjugative DNA transfer family protein, partial [Patescibacteria group bacterium]|nr:type IV secretory system conjugative DNA transfer family protein [Patescibacteria group bacterium]